MNWPADNLEDLMEALWTALREGADTQEHPFHVAALATQQEHGAAVRAMILRRADASCRLLTCSTDLRASKTAEIRRCPEVEWMFYDPRAMVQIRARGRTEVHALDPMARAAWDSTPWMIRAHYANPHVPGSVLPASRLERLGDLAQQAASLVQSDVGFANFGLLATEVHAIDWLQISKTGARHAGFTWSGGAWSGNWLV
jgi:hypothetical protein